MKIFDWGEAEKRNSPKKLELLRSTFQRELTEEEFVAQAQEIRKTAPTTRSFNPSKIRKMYRNLRDEFGFFLKDRA